MTNNAPDWTTKKNDGNRYGQRMLVIRAYCVIDDNEYCRGWYEYGT